MENNDDMFDKDFLESVSLNTPAPGGGRVSATVSSATVTETKLGILTAAAVS